MFASMGMPGLMGFWTELYILLGAFGVFRTGTGLAAIGIIITAGYFVWTLQRMAFGVTSETVSGLEDISRREMGAVLPLVALMVLFGLAPSLFISPWLTAITNLAINLGR